MSPHKIPIDARTRYCAVYGRPVRHSASPAMQNAGIAALGLNWRYLAFEVEPSQLRTAVLGAMAMGFVGLNLTVPHKLLALDMVDGLDESARTWGAVNTVRFEGLTTSGEWRPIREFEELPSQIRSHGFNTDADAITRSLREDLGMEARGARILILGAGGAGRTAALRLASEHPKELWLVNRTEDKARAVADEIQSRYGVTARLGYPNAKIDLLLNATSLGLKPHDALPLDMTRFPISNASAVYDMVYRPAETPLLGIAREAGCRTANGLGMLLYQGAKALEIWSGLDAPVSVMREALRKNVYG